MDLFIKDMIVSKIMCTANVFLSPLGVRMEGRLRPPGVLLAFRNFGYIYAFLNGCPPDDPFASLRSPFGVLLKLSGWKNRLPSLREGMAPILSHSSHRNITSHAMLNLISPPSVGEYFPQRLDQECLVPLLKRHRYSG
jgi:hypothetical protein